MKRLLLYGSVWMGGIAWGVSVAAFARVYGDWWIVLLVASLPMFFFAGAGAAAWDELEN